MTKFIVANWKNYGNDELINEYALAFSEISKPLIVCPPFPLIPDAVRNLGSVNSLISIGAQDCSAFDQGSHTGDVPCSLLKELGCRYVIIGHSERRKFYHEADELIFSKAQLAIQSGLIPIICVGEAQQENFEQVLKKQLQLFQGLSDFIVAYEPLSSVGKAAEENEDKIKNVVDFVHQIVGQDISVLYGGGVNQDNAQTFLAITDGILVGRACLHINQFQKIVD